MPRHRDHGDHRGIFDRRLAGADQVVDRRPPLRDAARRPRRVVYCRPRQWSGCFSRPHGRRLPCTSEIWSPLVVRNESRLRAMKLSTQTPFVAGVHWTIGKTDVPKIRRTGKFYYQMAITSPQNRLSAPGTPQSPLLESFDLALGWSHFYPFVPYY